MEYFVQSLNNKNKFLIDQLDIPVAIKDNFCLKMILGWSYGELGIDYLPGLGHYVQQPVLFIL